MDNAKGKKIRTSLDYLSSLIEMLLKYHGDITDSALISMFYNIFFAVRESLYYVMVLHNELNETLCDEYDLNYEVYHRKIKNCYNNLNDEFDIKNKYSLHQENKYKYSTIEELQNKEGKRFDFTNCSSLNIKAIGGNLWDKHIVLQFNILDGLKKIINYLYTLKTDINVFEADYETFEEKYEGSFEFVGPDDLAGFKMIRERLYKMYQSYMSNVWKYDKEYFKEQIRNDRPDTEKNKEYYEKYLRDYERKASSLQNLYLKNHEKLAISIYHKRNNYTQGDINELFAFMCCHTLLRQRILSFDYLCPPDEKYKKIFKNKACQILAVDVCKIILRVLSYQKQYSLSALFMAFYDFGICKEITARKQMAEFINTNMQRAQFKEVKEDNMKPISYLLGRNFGKLKAKDLEKINMSQPLYESLKSFYWGCYSVLNYIFEFDTEEEGFNDYLSDVDKETLNRLTKDDLMVLEKDKLLKSVITGEATDF